MKRVSLFAANWKMNKLVSEVEPFFSCLEKALNGKIPAGSEVVVAPPATHLGSAMKSAPRMGVGLASQNPGPAKSGAFTGEIPPAVFKELGCAWALIGHSERRHVFNETDDLLLKRSLAAIEGGLVPIFCVGETLSERKAGKTISVVESQLSLTLKLPKEAWEKLVVAYEPVWAIGTGETATPAQAQEVHRQIRSWIGTEVAASTSESVRILYGGSVKPENASEIMAQPDVDGLLVGGASLDANTFAEIIKKGLTSPL